MENQEILVGLKIQNIVLRDKKGGIVMKEKMKVIIPRIIISIENKHGVTIHAKFSSQKIKVSKSTITFSGFCDVENLFIAAAKLKFNFVKKHWLLIPSSITDGHWESNESNEEKIMDLIQGTPFETLKEEIEEIYCPEQRD